MNKTELIKAIADKSSLLLKDSEKFLNSFSEVVAETLSKKEDVLLVEFGTFLTVDRSARIGRNFKTGRNIKVPASKSVKFRPGKKLKNAVQ
jgi:DNA-binding protein HU-beta